MNNNIDNIIEIEETMMNFIRKFLSDQQNLHSQKVIEFSNDNVFQILDDLAIPNEGRPMCDVLSDAVDFIYKYRAKLNHPRYFGFVPGPASLISWVADVVTNAYNMHAGSWMSTPTASYIEKELIAWLNNKIGYTEQSGGIFVSGGSIANITALTVARDNKLNGDLAKGIAYISDQTHSSVKKGLKIIGVSDRNIRIIQTDNFKLNTMMLNEQIKADLSLGLKPFIVIASAGSTNTGSIDQMEDIHRICQKFNLWMHVDGAYGATVLLSKKHKSKLKGIEKADSVSWDAHKWLFQTYGCGMILVKNKNLLFHSFHTNPEYLRDAQINNEEINFWDFGMELTRPARALKLWFTLQVLGSDKMEEFINHGIRLAEYAESEVLKYKDWNIITKANLAIVNFRFSPPHFDDEIINKVNTEISRKMVSSAYAGVFTTILNGQVVLRICTINPETTDMEIKKTIALLDKYARAISVKMLSDVNKSKELQTVKN
ncbi:aminotransferase class I/II-fold pyridoxal phosphate-dependent enzyme [Lysinibacillus sphaericus]|uniref:Decarboxylase, pyridoxal-dependent n=1 Tax=Lysinibacillus sphaericus TaxID=1421 RepID=A0A2S0K0K1_LYSSH|nr:aminotransferase class I/II-fold pyridoxal phosphate-dependent enzyme [Lysinibacillus sphaericus]AVK96923.1 glutamate decarboxylase [Lysinibacillus sphaericus]MED4542197.1 aminotransferase class I/II-fold pyridoxal phosphate-dependent enzyme [Lysinibacillus sphaericus]TKI20512.1 aminotransferase class I/II-fold pyridoxal phosphate-dependent enzyme [Lysinibacillus sphaericus]SUV17235.1 decarboxylase, pyridoxal-dependent [Lysinibacillus sphaericus]GEC81798.1 pyridoxal-dependent decarboxylase 